MEISVIIPVYNEEANIDYVVESVTNDLNKYIYEIIFVNDGSVDNSEGKIQKHVSQNEKIKLISYEQNIGRGYALRQGINIAKGDIIATIDADLSYDSIYIPKMIDFLSNNPSIEIVLGSPYLRGGSTVGVNKPRLLISKIANKFLSIIMPIKFATYTSILRAYRKDAIKSLNLQSDDKDIHIEIISKANIFGYRIAEIPVSLKSRKYGKSKTKPLSVIFSHIIFSFFEKPSFYFSFFGIFLILIGLISGGYLIYLWQLKLLNPNRPLINLTVILLLAGMQLIIFSLLASFIALIKKEVLSLQKKLYFLSKRDER